MPQLRVLAFLSVAILLSLAAAPNAQADPLVFSNVRVLQNNNTTQVDLLSNPGVTLVGNQLTFLVDVSGVLPPGTTNTLQLTFNAAGGPLIVQNIDIPVFGTEFPPFTVLTSFPTTGVPSGTVVSFTVDILGSSPDFVLPGGQLVNSFTYTFIVTEPVPEPFTMLTLGSGLVGLAVRLRTLQRRRATKSSS